MPRLCHQKSISLGCTCFGGFGVTAFIAVSPCTTLYSLAFKGHRCCPKKEYHRNTGLVPSLTFFIKRHCLITFHSDISFLISTTPNWRTVCMWNFLFGGKDIICLCVRNCRRGKDHNSVRTTCQRASWQNISMTKPPVLTWPVLRKTQVVPGLQLRAVVVVTGQLSMRVGVWWCGEHHIIRAHIRRYRCCSRCCCCLRCRCCLRYRCCSRYRCSLMYRCCSSLKNNFLGEI